MNQLTINIAYKSDNQSIINELVNNLKGTNVSFNLIASDNFVLGEDFQKHLMDDGNPCFLMISDNYLKSISCLKNALSYLQALIKKELVIPIIIDGVKMDSEGNKQLIPTQFEKVSNVIKYMNYWQEKYLDLRKLKRSIPAIEEEEFLDKLKVVRSISSEVGEFLRNLRETNYYSYKEFAKNNYEAFFRNFGDEASYLQFVATRSDSNEEKEESVENPTTASDSRVVSTIDETSNADLDETIIESDQLETVETTKKSDFLPIDDLLSEKDNLENINEDNSSSLNEIVEPELIENSISSESSTPVLPLSDLIIEKDNLENSREDIIETNIEEAEVSAKETTVQEEVVLEPKSIENPVEISINGDATPEEIDEEKLIAMDPEWDNVIEEKADISEEEEEMDEPEEIPLSEIAAGSIRPLTDTEILALELADTLPANEQKNGAESNSLMEEEEEMISLEDLLGEDLLNATETGERIGNVEEEEIESESSSDSNSGENSSFITNKDLFSSAETEITQTELALATNTVQKEIEEEEEEEELEGYFVEEEEESEEFEEELSEFEVLQSANTLVQSGKIQDGLNLLTETLKEAPDFVSVRYQYAAFLAKYQNNFKGASKQLSILLEQEPNNLSAKFFLGELAEAERDYLSAKSYYEKVYEENPEFPNAAYKLAMLLNNHLKETPEKAANFFQHAFRQNPENINALYQLSLLQSEALNQEGIAIQSLEKVLEKAPEHPFANYDLAIIYHKQGQKEKALTYYEKAADINPELKTKVNDQAFAIATEKIEDKAEKIALSAIDETTVVEESSKETSEINLPFVKVEEEKNTLSIANEEATSKEEAIDSELVETEEKSVVTKTVLITGATSGIGKATAAKFAEAGYQLILTGRRFSRLFKIKDQFEKDFNSKIKVLPFDIQDSAAVHSALTDLGEEWQTVDILINNAGMARGETAIHEGDLDSWETMIDTNLKGLLYVTREIAPFMVKRKEGQIINVCSLAGKEVYPNNAVYCATKHAVDALTKAMRIDLHKYNIRVSQVSPGFVEDTEFALVKQSGDAEKAKDTFNDFMPINANDVAAVIYFIATQPKHVNLQEVVLTGTQQASANFIDRSGRGGSGQ